jgi:hypothetical protein
VKKGEQRNSKSPPFEAIEEWKSKFIAILGSEPTQYSFSLLACDLTKKIVEKGVGVLNNGTFSHFISR